MIEFLTKVANTCACSVGRPELNLEEDRGVSFTSTSATKEHTQRMTYIVIRGRICVYIYPVLLSFNAKHVEVINSTGGNAFGTQQIGNMVHVCIAAACSCRWMPVSADVLHGVGP